jgi:hypothetical protein
VGLRSRRGRARKTPLSRTWKPYAASADTRQGLRAPDRQPAARPQQKPTRSPVSRPRGFHLSPRPRSGYLRLRLLGPLSTPARRSSNVFKLTRARAGGRCCVLIRRCSVFPEAGSLIGRLPVLPRPSRKLPPKFSRPWRQKSSLLRETTPPSSSSSNAALHSPPRLAQVHSGNCSFLSSRRLGHILELIRCQKLL